MWSKILDLQECFLQEAPSNDLRLAVRNYAIKKWFRFFDVRNQEGFLRTLMFRQNSHENGWFYSNCIEKRRRNREQLFDYILEKFPQIKTLVLPSIRNRMILFMI